jgi:DNA polymerase
MSNSINNNDLLNTIANDIKICKLCQLSNCRINAVPGEGGFRKRLMIIGEAPGFYEDQVGRPFIGAAGKILRKMLKKCGIDEEDVFITNIVKCRPPNNRQPKKDEKDRCIKYLEKQIELLQPKVICILGNVASSYLIDMKSLTQERGKIVKKDHRNYFITYHPAATIYNRQLFSTFENDIKNLAEIINKN